MQHLEQVLSAVEKMQNVSEDEQWEQMLRIIRMTQQKEEIIRQYYEKRRHVIVPRRTAN